MDILSAAQQVQDTETVSAAQQVEDMGTATKV